MERFFEEVEKRLGILKFDRTRGAGYIDMKAAQILAIDELRDQVARTDIERAENQRA
jgi:hypothetical protein